MRACVSIAWGLLTVAAACGQTPAPAAFCDQVKALTSDPTVAAAHWGISVTARDGTALCSLNEAQFFRPASTNKLFTATAALALLGPDRRFTTSVVGEGKIANGVLQGDLRLIGGGDANFGSQDVPYVAPAKPPKPAPPEPATIADIEELADQVVAKGVKTIAGGVIGDDGAFSWEPYPRGWEIDDMIAGFGAPVSALTVHDNLLQLAIAPGAAAGAPALATMAPSVPYYTLEGTVATTQPVHEPHPHLRLERAVGSLQLKLAGDLPANAAVVKTDVAIQDPAMFAALALKAALERRGVTIAGAAAARHRPLPLPGSAKPSPNLGKILEQPAAPTPAVGLVNCYQETASLPDPAKRTVLATHLSPALQDDLLYTLKDSQNLHAELLLRNLGTAYTCQQTQSDSLTVLQAYLAHAGIAPSDLVQYDGSGLSSHDLVTPRSLTQLLVFASGQKWFDGFKSSLPIGGVDGTLANRFTAPTSKLQGRVFAKTGTLGESRDLAGYLTAASGQTLVFSVLVDNHPPGSAADRTVMDKIVELIAAQN